MKIGIDLGGSHIAIGLVDDNLEIIVKPYIGTNITKSFLILPGYGKFSGWYRLYVYNEEVKYENWSGI